MRRPFLALLAVAATLAPWHALDAQRAGTRAGVLHGLRYTLPARFTPAASLSDAGTAVYADTARHEWAAVALLPHAAERPAVIRSLLRRLGGAALGREGVEWMLGIVMPADSAEQFHQRMISLGGERSLDVTFRQFRVAGNDVLVGSASELAHADMDVRLCGATSGFAADEVTQWIIASLLGRPAPEMAMGFQELSPGSSPSAPAHANPEARRVLDAFDAYARAIRAHDRAAVGQVAPAVLAFYADLRELALHATPAEVRALPLVPRMLVLMARHRLEAGRLRAMSPTDLFVFLEVENGAFDPSIGPGDPVMGPEPGLAWLQLKQGTESVFLRIGFVRVGGSWRVDTLPTLAGTECLFRGSLRASGTTREQEDALLLRTIEAMTGRAPSPAIWEPLEPARQ
ncbi:MAG: hypothetical protein ACJ8J0_00850 [Longimicrobiaceae bacterium]